jgi:WD40 repeat protein
VYQIPNYLIATSTATLVHIAPGFEDWMTVVGQSQNAAVTCLAAHPSRTLLLSGSYSGRLQVWNYSTREVFRLLSSLQSLILFQLEQTVHFENGRHVQSLAYSPNGHVVAVGLTNGTIDLLDSVTLQPIGTEVRFDCFSFLFPRHS